MDAFPTLSVDRTLEELDAEGRKVLHTDIDLALSQRTQEKGDKYREERGASGRARSGGGADFLARGAYVAES